MVERLAADLRDVPPPAVVADAAPAGTASGGPRFQLRPVPILMVVLLGFGLPILAKLLIDFASDHVRLPWIHSSNLSFLYVDQGVLFVLALIAIAIARRVVPTDYGLHWPSKRSYAGAAVLLGIGFGVLTALVDFAPQIVNKSAPKFDDPVTGAYIAGWLVFAGVYNGPTQEVLNRALLVPYLSATMPGKVRFAGYEMNGAGVVVAFILSLWVITSFLTLPPLVALLQFAYTFAFGVLCAYWLEKSGSVLAPIVATNVSGAIKYALMFAMIAAWR